MSKSLSGKGASDTLTIRIPKNLKKDVERAATASDRTITHYVIHALKGQMLADGK